MRRIPLKVGAPEILDFKKRVSSGEGWILRTLYDAIISYLTGVYGICRILLPSLNKKKLPILFGIILLAGIGQAGYGLGQLYGWWPSHHHLFPITGTFLNPGPYSGWLACVLPVAVYGILFKEKSGRNKWLGYLCWIYLFLATLVLIPAASRAAMLAALSGAVVILWPKVKYAKIWDHTWIKGSIATVLVAGLVGMYLIKKDSADGRLLIYKVTADMIADAPIFGWGWDGFPRMYNNFQAVYFESGYGSEREIYLADNVTYGFNEILEFTAEMGILGLFIITCIGILIIRKWYQRFNNNRIYTIHFLGLGVLTTWIVFALFSYPMSIPVLVLILPLSISGLNSMLNNSATSFISNYQGLFSDMVLNRGTCILLVGLSVYVLYWVNQYRIPTTEWKVANGNYQLHQYDIANNYYGMIYPHFKNEGLFLQYVGKSYSQARKFYQSGPILERALFFSADPTIFNTLGKDYTAFSKVDTIKKERALFLLERAKYISPYKYYPRYLLTKYYRSMGNKLKALNEAEALLMIQPKVPSPATEEVRHEMQQLVDQKIFQIKNNIYPVTPKTR